MEQQPKIISVYGSTTEQRRQKELTKRRWTREQAYNARSGLLTSIMLARWAIHMAVRGESNRKVRRVRENILLERFSRFAGDLSRLPLGRRS